jgi:hypothetical protein
LLLRADQSTRLVTIVKNAAFTAVCHGLLIIVATTRQIYATTIEVPARALFVLGLIIVRLLPLPRRGVLPTHKFYLTGSHQSRTIAGTLRG